jgi:thiosulfate reductase cytochrome b subunit
MKKALAATNTHFESSCSKTPQYVAWHRLFKREFTKFLTAKGATNIQIGKPNHFDMSGFFTLGNTIWYFSISDLRNFYAGKAQPMLLRTAKHYKDYTGGMNQYVSMNNEEVFKIGFDRIVTRLEENTLLHATQAGIASVDMINAATINYMAAQSA